MVSIIDDVSDVVHVRSVAGKMEGSYMGQVLVSEVVNDVLVGLGKPNAAKKVLDVPDENGKVRA